MDRAPWFAGYCYIGEREPAARPVGARPVLHGRRRLWADHPVRLAQAAGWTAVISGICPTDTPALERILADVADGRRDIEALTGLGGSYHVVVDDGSTLTAIGDLAGIRQLYIARLGALCAFASTPHALTGLTGARLDRGFLAARLFCPEAVELHDHATAFDGISCVPAGSMLRCGPDGIVTTTRRRPAAQAGPGSAVAVGDALDAAVAARCCGTVSADLSGGLDSTSLVALAARRTPLLAMTYIDPLASGDEDVAFARKAAGLLPGVEHEFVEGDASSLPYTGLETNDLTVFDEPSQDALLAARTRLRTAPALGRDVHLAGDGGDVVLAGDLTYMADLARMRRYRALLRETAGWARLRHRPATTVLRAALRCAHGTYTQDVRGCADRLDALAAGSTAGWSRPGIEAHLTWCRTSAADTWATPAAARDLAARLRSLGDLDALPVGADTMALRAVHRHGALTRNTQRLAATWGLNLQAPFLDDAVVIAASRIPVVERTTVTAAKPLLRAALGQVVPQEVLARRSKGDYTAAEYAGLRAAGPYLRTLLASPALADLGLIEPTRVLAVLDNAVSGQAVPLGALAEVIATELWLRAGGHTTAYPWTREDQ